MLKAPPIRSNVTTHASLGSSPQRSSLRALSAALVIGTCLSAVPVMGWASDISSSPGVVVDQSVLDSLGPVQTVPDLLLPPSARPLSQQPGAALPSATPQDGTHRLPDGLLPAPQTPPVSRLQVPMPSGTASHPTRLTAPSPAYRPNVTVTAPAPTAPSSKPHVLTPPPAASTAPTTPSAPTADSVQTSRPAPAPSPSAVKPTPSEEQPSAASSGFSVSTSTPASTPAETAKPATPEASLSPTTDTATPVAKTPPPPSPAPKAPTIDQAAPSSTPSTTSQQATSAPSARPQASAAGLTIPFSADGASIPDSANAALDDLVKQMSAQPDMTVRIEAYASGGSAGMSRARRMSLSRALAVRSYLLDKGIDATRVEVRALGTPDSGNKDRVDISWE